MNKTSIEWTDLLSNPLKYRRKSDGKVVLAYNAANMEELEPFIDEAELHKILTAKTVQGITVSGSKCFLGDMTDLFGEWVPDELLDRLFDVIWERKDVIFQILTKRADRASEYIKNRASKRSFGWTALGMTPLSPGDHIHFDDFAGRNQCGYVGDEDWSCDHPCNESKGEEYSCRSYECPIAYTVTDKAALTKIDVADGYKFDDDDHADNSEWMVLHGRPLHAMPANLWLGFSAENQTEYTDRIRQFRRLRFENPYLTLFCSLEPLLGPIDFKIKYWEENEGGPNWSPLEGVRFSDGSFEKFVPTLNQIIVGGESGHGARPYDLAWPRSIIAQCRAAGVPVFHKQLGSHIHEVSDGGQLKSWFPNDPKGGDMSEWPEDLRVREYPKASVTT